MGFAGNLRTLTLAEVLQTLNRIQATGVLRIARPAGSREVVFNKGEIVGVILPEGAEAQHLLRRLLMEDKIDAQSAAQITSVGRESQVLSALLERGLARPDDIEDARRRQAEDELYDIATWDSGDFVFNDVGPGAPEATAQVERCCTRPLRIIINSLLIESARRQDEFDLICEKISDDRVIYGPSAGGENRLRAYAKGYPLSAVIPLIDAIRSVEELIRDCVATRFDVYAVLAELIDKELIVPLSDDDILYHADYLFDQGDAPQAARLYRRVLQARPENHAASARLADCIEAQGDVPEAAASYGQLALGRLGSGDREQAVIYADKAVALSPTDVRLRLVLVRCKIACDQTGDAVEHLRGIARDQQAEGLLEDSRNTLLKILELSPEDEGARRDLARIFSDADGSTDSEDVVVCVSCGHVNHREAKDCHSCATPLHLSCLSCNRVVAASDRLCIFCGADPHGGQRRRQAAGSPTTSRFVDPTRAKASTSAPNFRNQLEKLIHTATALEEGGDLAQALERWRDVAKVQVDSPELVRHIKDLEDRIKDKAIEADIEKGHQYKRIRRYWSAVSAYRRALQAMASDDPRAPRLSSILSGAQRSHYIALGVYASALLLFVVIGYISMRPRWVLGEIENRAQAMGAEIASVGAVPELTNLSERLEKMKAEVEGFGDSARAGAARSAIQEAHRAITTRRAELFARVEKDITNAIDKGKLDDADRQLKRAQQEWVEERSRLSEVQRRLIALQNERTSIEQQLRDAPERLGEAELQEANQRWSEAQVRFESLVNSPHGEVAQRARISVARLSASSAAFTSDLQRAESLIASDLAMALRVVTALDAPARAWGANERVVALKGRIEQQRNDAELAWMRLGEQATTTQIEDFISRFPGSAQRNQAKDRLQRLLGAQAARSSAIAAHRQLIADKQWEKAWSSARELRRAYGSQLPAGEIQIPVWVESQPSAAEVRLDGTLIGTTPCVVLVPVERTQGALSVTAPACEAEQRNLPDMVGDWKLTVLLARHVRWRFDMGKPVTRIAAAGERAFITAGEILADIDAQGRQRFKSALGGNELNRSSRLNHAPVQVKGSGMVVGLPDAGVEWLNDEGVSKGRWASTGTVRGQPSVFSNDMLGPGTRVAIAAEALFVGEPGKDPLRIALPRAAVAGPFAAVHDLDRLLVVLTEDGKALGIEDSTKRTAFTTPLQFQDAGQLLPLNATSFAVLLDGQRLASYQVRKDGLQSRWSQPLAGSVIDDAVLSGQTLLVAVGRQVLRFTSDGAPLPALTLPAVATSAPAMAGDVIAVGCGRQLAVFSKGVVLWVGATPSPITAVGLVNGQLLAGCEDGVVRAYAP